MIERVRPAQFTTILSLGQGPNHVYGKPVRRLAH